MSSLMFIARDEEDPYLACLIGQTEHPRYHDCDNCPHVADKTCEYGVGQKNLRDIRAAIAEGKELLAKCRPKLDPKRLP